MSLSVFVRRVRSKIVRRLSPQFRAVLGRRRLRRGTKILAELARPGHHIWAGYYDLQVISPDERRIAYHCWRPGDADIEFGTFDLESGSFDPIGRTLAWSFQLGTRLQFVGDDIVAFYSDIGGPLATTFYDLRSRHIQRSYPDAFFSISPSQRLVSFLNYQHIRMQRPGYGFPIAGADPQLALKVVAAESGETLLYVSLQDALHLARDLAGDPDLDVENMHVNHSIFSPDDRRVAFVLASFRQRRLQSLVVQSFNGDVRVCPLASASHNQWITSSEMTVFGTDKSGETRYWRWNVDEGSLVPHGEEWPTVDGHQTPHPLRGDAVWLVDAYPDRLGYQPLFVISGQQRRHLGSFYAPFGMGFDKCDLHPRFGPKGETILIDSAYDGYRRSMLVSANLLRDV